MPEKSTDILEEIPDHKLEQLLEIISKELPASIYHYEFLKTVFKWRKNDPSYEVSIFWTREMESGIYVAILYTGNKTCGLVFYAVEGYEALLENVLMRSKKIKWEALPIIQGIMPRHYELVEKVVKSKHFIPKVYVDSTIQYLDPNIASSYSIECLPDVNLKRLTSADIDCIFDLWPLNDVYTRDDIRCPVEQNVAFGLYHKRSNEPLAWVMQTHYGAIGMLYTKENVRRNGYARTLIKVMVKELTKNSVLPYATIIATNAKSISLFHSMGFRQISPMRYVTVCKN